MSTGENTDEFERLRAENDVLRGFLRRALVAISDEVHRPSASDPASISTHPAEATATDGADRSVGLVNSLS